jgi:hypothetical protein
MIPHVNKTMRLIYHHQRQRREPETRINEAAARPSHRELRPREFSARFTEFITSTGTCITTRRACSTCATDSAGTDSPPGTKQS